MKCLKVQNPQETKLNSIAKLSLVKFQTLPVPSHRQNDKRSWTFSSEKHHNLDLVILALT